MGNPGIVYFIIDNTYVTSKLLIDIVGKEAYQ